MIKDVKAKISQVNNLIDLTAKQMKDYLVSIQEISAYPEISSTLFLLQYLRREKAIFTCLNMLQRNGQLVHGYVWTNLSRDEFMSKFNAGTGVNESFSSQVYDSGRGANIYNLQVEEIDSS